MGRRLVATVLATALLTAGSMLGSGPVAAEVSPAPAATPQIGGSSKSGTDGTVELVRQLTQCGSTMYAVGRFSQVRNPGSATPVARNNAFAFRATAPHTILQWNPNVNGQVDTVACSPDGAVLLGGTFTRVGGVTARNLAKVDAVTGASRGFAFQPQKRVAHIEVVTDAGGVRHLLVGGYFDGYLKSVDPVSGKTDFYGTPTISGTYQYPGVSSHSRRIWNMSVSPDGRAVLMTGVFTSVGGQRHEQVFRLNLTAGSSTVSIWSPKNLYTKCAPDQPFYARDAAWAPDMSQVYVATTGLRTAAESALPASQRPATRSGPCDAVMAFTAKEGAFSGHRWINYTGCDSLYSVAADETTVFAGGHQRWVSNGNGCDRQGPGGIAQPGLSHVDASTGAHQPGADRARGIGAQDLLRTPAGLWIASDNQNNSSFCGGVSSRMGICFLPE